MSDTPRFHAETAIFVAHDDFKRRDVAEAERNLMRAVLQTAMEDIRKKGEVYNDARRYFNSKDDYYLYSFLSICYHLDLCPRTIRTLVGLCEDAERLLAAATVEAVMGTAEEEPVAA